MILKKDLLPIKVVAQRTGLTPHVIRIWEKRYNAVLPERSASNRRFYSNKEVIRLSLLRQVIEKGFTIGQVAKLTDLELLAIVEESKKENFFFESNKSCAEYVENCLLAIQEMDAFKLDKILTQSQVELSPQVLIEFLVAPLLNQIGDLWQKGEIRIVQEHLASSVIRSFLGRLMPSSQPLQASPKLITATPKGQLHELGALIASLVASYEGWNVIYLGPNLPAEELAKAAEQHQAQALALSIIYPSDDPYIHLELKKLAELLGENTKLVVGGQAATAYQITLSSINAILVGDLKSLRAKLAELRNPTK